MKFLISTILALTLFAPMSFGQADAKVNLRVWDGFTDSSQSASMDAMIAKFEATHPNIKIERDAQQLEVMRPVIQTALGSGTGPDVFYYDNGPGYAGVLAKAGLLLPLDDAYQSYGWNKRLFGWTKAQASYDGKTYGIANEVEFIGVYYNKKIFSQLGITEPKTYEEFLKICEKAKAAGYTPIAFADGPKWPAFHQFSIMANNIAGKAKLDNILYNGGSWDDPDVVKAIQLFFVDMNRAGYFLKGTTAIKYEDGNQVFFDGKAAMHMTGTWLLNEINANAKDYEVGYFFFPSIGGKPVLPPGGLGGGYYVSAKTKYAKESKEFLDFLFSEQSAKDWLETMSIIPPMAVKVDGLKLTPLLKAAVNAVATVQMGYNIDVLAGDEFNAAQGDGYQAVLVGKKTAAQLAKELQVAWLKDKAKNKTK